MSGGLQICGNCVHWTFERVSNEDDDPTLQPFIDLGRCRAPAERRAELFRSPPDEKTLTPSDFGCPEWKERS